MDNFDFKINEMKLLANLLIKFAEINVDRKDKTANDILEKARKLISKFRNKLKKLNEDEKLIINSSDEIEYVIDIFSKYFNLQYKEEPQLIIERISKNKYLSYVIGFENELGSVYGATLKESIVNLRNKLDFFREKERNYAEKRKRNQLLDLENKKRKF